MEERYLFRPGDLIADRSGSMVVVTGLVLGCDGGPTYDYSPWSMEWGPSSFTYGGISASDVEARSRLVGQTARW